MKLSEKGIEKVKNYSSVDLEVEGFEPDDFQNVVVLSVDEAKFLARCCVFLSGFDKRYDVEGAKDFHRKLTKRIARAEAVQLCADYNKALNRVAEELQRQADIDICRGMDLDTTYSDMLNKTIKEVAEND